MWSSDGTENSPHRRAHHSAVIAGDRMIIYGGHSPKYELLDDAWSYDFGTSTWTRIVTTGAAPGPRAGKEEEKKRSCFWVVVVIIITITIVIVVVVVTIVVVVVVVVVVVTIVVLLVFHLSSFSSSSSYRPCHHSVFLP